MTMPLPDPAGMFERAPELLSLAQADDAIARAVARGNPHAVYRSLWWARLRGRLGAHRPTLDALLGHRALFVTPARRSPLLTTVNGVGASVYGRADEAPDGSYVKTHFLVFAFVPIFPLAQYLVRDAEEKGWYFLGKVPMSAPLRAWNRLAVLGVLAGVMAGALQAFHWSRHHEVHLVNGLPWPVRVAIGDVAQDVAPRQRQTVTVRTGLHPVRVTSATGQPIESADLQVDAGTDVLVWNVLGAAPLMDRTVAYGDQVDGRAIPEPQLLCGERSIRRPGVDYAFTDPPQTLSMSRGQKIAFRRQLAWLPGEVDVCANAIAGRRNADQALTLARGMALADARGTHIDLAVGLCRAVGKRDEALQLAEQALARHPESVEHHRQYQSMAQDLGKDDALVATYKARFAQNPKSADAAYLYARLLPDPEGIAEATRLVQVFPDHVPLRRILIFRHIRDRRFGEALASLERVRALDRGEWSRFVEEHLVALAGLGRVEEARRVAEEAFARQEGPRGRIAAIHTWLGRGQPTATAPLLMQLAAGSPPEEHMALQVRYWTAAANASLQPLGDPQDRVLYELMQHAHYDPVAALKDVARVRTDDLAQLEDQVLILLLGEARRASDAVATQRLEAAAERSLPVAALRAYLDDGTWAGALDELTLAEQGALHLARSRQHGLSLREREELVALAHGCDPVGGYVRMALAGWPQA
ncbi:MAG TPA: tetratricopeptide repeat protein [Vicinamibacteria bacterium]